MRVELRKNNLRTKFRDKNSAVQDVGTFVDYSQFVDSIQSYCPSLFAKKPPPFFNVAESDDIQEGDETERANRQLKMKLRLIFIKLLNQQNHAAPDRLDRRKVDVAQFFRALVENDFKLGE